MPLIYDYTDYRCFLKDRFNELKEKNPRFSYRVFNRLAGSKSSGFLKLVMDGKRNLADDGIRMIAKGFRLPEEETKYFSILVRFNQAQTHEEKDHFLQELAKNKKFIRAKPLSVAQYRLFSQWYCVAIIELLRLGDRGEVKNAQWLQARLHPNVGLREVKRAVKELKAMGLLSEGSHGDLVSKETMLSTPDEVRSVSVANFHSEMSRMGAEAVFRDNSQEREFSALTIATSEKGFEQAKKAIREFRKKLHSILEQEEGAPKSVVGHVNLQLFKLSKNPISP